jgi:hypothetical protein
MPGGLTFNSIQAVSLPAPVGRNWTMELLLLGTGLATMGLNIGSQWGEEGYIRMQRDVDAKEGLCGIAMEASYPTA